MLEKTISIKMSIIKWLSLVGPVAGMILTGFYEWMPHPILAAAGSILVALGTLFFAHISQGENLEKVRAAHRNELELLQAQLDASGQEFLIKQYAEDTVQATLVRGTLKDITQLLNGSTDPQYGAIKVALSSIDRLQFFGFFSKGGELLSRNSGSELLKKLLYYIERISATYSEIPPELENKVFEMRQLLQAEKAGANGKLEVSG